jgi:quaternary ammonium compound-resistance protein SugE
MAWMFVLAAGLLEIVWAFTKKLSQGFTRPTPTAVTILAMLASFALMSLSMKTLPLGTAYTVTNGRIV